MAFEMSAKWYSPQLSREIVRRLYHRAKVERIPMTVLANRIMEKALDTGRVIVGPNAQRDALNQQQSRRAEGHAAPTVRNPVRGPAASGPSGVRAELH